MTENNDTAVTQHAALVERLRSAIANGGPEDLMDLLGEAADALEGKVRRTTEHPDPQP